jgi:N6-L-threonylcarbamoyladenine synthase
MNTLILAIETSCDETSIALLENRQLLSHVTFSQIAQHQKYHGVMPELASRLHTETITLVLEEALNHAQKKLEDIDAFAVTSGPGLLGALHIGIQFAKTLSLIFNKPLIPVHHLAAHIEAGRFIKPLKYPYLALLVSGGHTELVDVQAPLSYKIIGQTRDDAVGESYDKVARMLDLGYPGGPLMDELAQKGTPRYSLPSPLKDKGYDFSFSGLKTSVSLLIQKLQKDHVLFAKEDIASSFQHVAIDSLMDKTFQAVKSLGYQQLVIGGGVSANALLRKLALEKGEEMNVDVVIPPLWACTDNAAMIGLLAFTMYEQGQFASLQLKADPQWSIENLHQFQV